jgi:hypothetical protein
MHQNVKKTQHTTDKEGSQEVSHVHSLLSRQAGREEKNGTADFLGGSGLK